jgi:hypothetical protein
MKKETVIALVMWILVWAFIAWGVLVQEPKSNQDRWDSEGYHINQDR